MASVKVPSQFFKKERNIYWNWREAFWRELFQNSSDAKARRIDIDVREVVVDGRSIVRIAFNDNGCGMSREVLEDVYFALGETTKTNGDTVGGFGRARILTCFSMERYGLKTRNLVVEGRGAHYDLQIGTDFVQGCHLEIDIDVEGGDKDTMLRYLHNYLRYCRAPKIDIYINGQLWKDWCSKGRHIRDMLAGGERFGAIYAIKGGGRFPGETIVRVDGTMMFTLTHQSKAQIVVEIDKDKALNALTAGRDAFACGYDGPLATFIQELSVNCLSGANETARTTTTVVGKGFRVSRKPESAQEANKGASQGQGLEVSLDDAHKAIAALAAIGAQGSDQAGVLASAQKETFASEAGTGNLYDVYILNESHNPKVKKVIGRYNPNNWKTSLVNGREVSQGASIKKLLQQWEIALEEAVRCLLEASDMTDVSWTIGWAFSEDMRAAHRKADQGDVFYLNPVDDEGKLAFKLRERKSQKRLMALAKHEIAHAHPGSREYHNETFANVLTQVDEHYDERAVFARMKAM